MSKNTRGPEQFPEQEARRRFEAALRGARIAGPQHKEIVTPKHGKPQRKKRKKKSAIGIRAAS